MELEGFSTSVKVALMHWTVPPKRKQLYVVAVYCLLHSASVFDNAAAQPAPITPSGLNTQISGPISVGGQVQYDITGGTRAGTNLFHSFGEFGVPDHTIANFHNNSNSGLVTSNILGRVTGGKESHIFGTIRTSEFGNANLFLMNPAGFLFGPNAALDVGGMATFTSADYLRLEDGTRFNARPNIAVDALLSTWPVAAFGFLGSNPKAITVQGSHLEVKPDKGITLVGGNITIESGARLSAPNGTIQRAVAASPGEFDVTSLQSIPNVNKTSFTSFGSVTLAPNSTVNLSGTDTVSIHGGQFVLKMNDAVLSTAQSSGAANSISLGPNSSIISKTVGAESGPDIQIAVGTLKLSGTALSSTTSGAGDGGTVTLDAGNSISLVNSTISRNNEAPSGIPIPDNGRELHLSASRITLEQGSSLLARTTGRGHAGTITVNTNHLSLSGESVVQASTSDTGSAGNITVQGLGGNDTKAQTVSLTGGSQLSSSSSGNDEGKGGPAGHILVETHTLLLSQGSQITTSSISSPGDAGTITIHADEDVQLSKGILASRSESNISDAFVDKVVIGNAGSITVSAPTITLKNNSLIASTTDSRYAADPSKGNAGSVTINARNLSLTEGSQLTSSSIIGDSRQPPVGNAGTVTVQGLAGPVQSVLVDGHTSGIFTDTRGAGLRGHISLNASSVTLQNGGTISAETSGTTSRATGGSVTVRATDHVTMTNGASITARSTGPANAGKIEIDTGQQLLVQDSKITTEARQAKGGDITLVAIDRIHVVNGEISTSVRGGTGSGGNITIDPKIVVLQNSNILAKAVSGKGGDITITTQMFMPDSFSLNHIDASAPFGLNGTDRKSTRLN